MRKIAEDKPDLIKLMITGGVLDAKCEGEPGELKALRHVDLVIARGKVYRSPKVKKIEKAERELDKFL